MLDRIFTLVFAKERMNLRFKHLIFEKNYGRIAFFLILDNDKGFRSRVPVKYHRLKAYLNVKPANKTKYI